MALQYKTDVLLALKKAGYNTNTMRKNKLLSEGAIQALRQDNPISWASIEKICALLDCQPGDILEYIPDKKSAEGG